MMEDRNCDQDDDQASIDPEETPQMKEKDAVRVFYETYHNLYWQSVTFLNRAWAFYLTITAVLIGYVITREIDHAIKSKILLAAVVISVITLISLSAWSWGLYSIVKLLERLSVKLNKQLVVEVKIDKLFKEWRILIWLLGGLTVVVGVVLITGMLFLYARYV